MCVIIVGLLQIAINHGDALFRGNIGAVRTGLSSLES